MTTGQQRLEKATTWLLGKAQDEPAAVASAAFDYLMLAGTVVGAWQMGRAAEIAHRNLASEKGDADFYRAKIVTARFYSEKILPRSAAYLDAATSQRNSTMDLPVEQF